MKYKRVFCIAWIACLLLITLTGCKPEDFKLYYEIQTDITTVDPQLAENDSELLVIKNIFEGLYRLDHTGKPVSGAADCKISADGKQYRFTLRKNAQWYNGTPLTADDFAFGLERALTRTTGSPFAQTLFDIQNAENFYNGRISFDQTGIHIDSDRELTITLHTANKNFPFILASACAMPCNRKFFKSTKGRYGLDKKALLSNGSFYLQNWDEENGIVLHKDKDYNGAFTANAYAVSLSIAKDNNAAERLLKQNIDGGRVPYYDANRLPADDFTMQTFPIYTYALVFNAAIDQELRNILMQAADFSALQSTLTNYMTATDSLIPLTMKNNGGAIQYPAYDADLARKRFLQYTKQRQQPQLRVLCMKDEHFSTLIKQIITYWQNNLGAYGINIEFVETESEMLERMQAHDYNIALAPFQDNGGKIYDFLYCFSADAPQNYLNRKKGRFEACLASYAQSRTDAALQKVIQALSKENVLVPICSLNKVYALSSDYENAYFYNFGGEIDFSMLAK